MSARRKCNGFLCRRYATRDGKCDVHYGWEVDSVRLRLFDALMRTDGRLPREVWTLRRKYKTMLTPTPERTP